MVLAEKLEAPIFTPSSKAPAGDHDANISFSEVESLVGEDVAEQIKKTSLAIYNFATKHALSRGVIIADTKFEFGYVTDANGVEQLIYMDEVGTPDSSRIWDGPALRAGKVVENSKEGFRQFLLNHFDDPDILLNKQRMHERTALAKNNALPLEALLNISNTYVGIAEKITGRKLQVSQQPKEEIIDVLNQEYGLIR
jgi:phosphoribosylaminoimidazole-succinocarboxamide synthase